MDIDETTQNDQDKSNFLPNMPNKLMGNLGAKAFEQVLDHEKEQVESNRPCVRSSKVVP